MTDQDLQIRIFFEWLHPDIEAGSEKEKALTEEHRKRGKISMDRSIEAIRSSRAMKALSRKPSLKESQQK